MGSVQRLDLALLVDRQHQRFLRWIEVEAHHVLDLSGEVRVTRELEGLHQMRLEAVRAPDPLDAAGESPAAAAMVRTLQWVACGGLV